jgi:ribosomal protein S12 methylthiotransferase accessory factor
MSLLVEFVGNEALGARLAARISAEARRQGISDGHLTLVLARADELDHDELHVRREPDVVHVTLWQSLLFIGPRRTASGSGRGCVGCLLARLAGSGYGPSVDAFGRARPRSTTRDFPPLAIGHQGTVAHLAFTLWRSDHASSPEVFIVNAYTGAVFRERLLPDSTCRFCAAGPPPTLPHFTSAAAGAGTDRRRRVEEFGQRLEAIYAQPHLGPVKELVQDLQTPFAATTAQVRNGTRMAEITIGRSHSYAASRSIAVLEALERYCGMRRDVLAVSIRASFAEVADGAIDPRTLGLHPDESYKIEGFPFVPFTPDLLLHWVPAYSYRRRGPVLVPAPIAFYGITPTEARESICETSNGCALGSSLEEATVHGLLELVERDSFLMTWYRRLRLPELRLTGLPPALGAMIRKAELVTRFRFRGFVSTMEHGIPSVILVGVSRQQEGPRVLIGAGAHFRLERALASAVYELVGLILRVQHSFVEKRLAALPMLEDADLVRTIEDHPLVNSLPEAEDRFAFLLEGDRKLLRYEEVTGRSDLARSSSPEQQLDGMARRLLDIGLDIVVVDQTCEELQPEGLRCVKAIVPGLLPMTFGHRYRRVDLPRLRAPIEYASDAKATDELGAMPHPFP